MLVRLVRASSYSYTEASSEFCGPGQCRRPVWDHLRAAAAMGRCSLADEEERLDDIAEKTAATREGAVSAPPVQKVVSGEAGLTTSYAGASACAALYALKSPVRKSAPSAELYAAVVRGCEPSGFTQCAAEPGKSKLALRARAREADARFSWRVAALMDQMADSPPVVDGRACGEAE